MSPPALSPQDYDAIADAMRETERGRWFLDEFARRSRSAETAAVIEALASIEARLAEAESPPEGELARALEALADWTRRNGAFAAAEARIGQAERPPRPSAQEAPPSKPLLDRLSEAEKAILFA